MPAIRRKILRKSITEGTQRKRNNNHTKKTKKRPPEPATIVCVSQTDVIQLNLSKALRTALTNPIFILLISFCPFSLTFSPFFILLSERPFISATRIYNISMRTFGYARALGSREFESCPKVRAKRQFPHITDSPSLQGTDIDTLSLRRCGVATLRSHNISNIHTLNDPAPREVPLVRSNGRRNETSYASEELKHLKMASAPRRHSRISEGLSHDALFCGALEGPTPKPQGRATFPPTEHRDLPMRPIRSIATGETTACMGSL